jgi:hypothetical protein
MLLKIIAAACILWPAPQKAPSKVPAKTIHIDAPKLSLLLDYDGKASVTSMLVNGQQVISGADGIFTSVKVGGVVYSSLHVQSEPVLVKTGNTITLDHIRYGDSHLTIEEKWTFTPRGQSIKWTIERALSKAVQVDEAATPVFNFDSIGAWEGAYQGYGGLAWFYLFNQRLCTYGVHTQSSSFWNSKTGNGLNVAVDAPGEKVAMKYTRTNEDGLAYSITISDKEMVPHLDSGTNRRRFIRHRTDVWAPFTIAAGKSIQSISLSYFEVDARYGRGKFVGVDGAQVSGVLNTIARIGVIDSLHFGGNSWHTPYGPICLHEQYIGQLGLGIDDPAYLKGYQSCLEYYREHAIKPDGRVFPRWAYTDEDMMPGQGNKDGFYEAQWGILMDSNPDLVTNVSDLYDMTGDKVWVKRQQLSCEKALDWILHRDTNGNGLVEMMTDNESQGRSSDWIDIIWASFENAFVNAKLYHALVEWAAIERQLNNDVKADEYEHRAALLKASFNKPTTEGGFWDEEKGCYVHWIDKDKTVHGRNMVTPVNFMAIAYDICDDPQRKKRILDGIEAQMQRENLFFWPITMTSYALGEGKDWQFPFPAYENGDLFLSWGSVAVKAYAEYNPALAIKYVKNVLNQYSKDGLAFQRYGRLKQDGLGDDILAGNSLAIVGLYQAVYGINPLYNRFYLDPHMTNELSGTELRYNYRGDRLTIHLDSGSYAVSNKRFKVISPTHFGFYAAGNRLSYFEGKNATPALIVTSETPLTLVVSQQEYVIRQLAPGSEYWLVAGGHRVAKRKSDGKGNLVIRRESLACTLTLSHAD